MEGVFAQHALALLSRRREHLHARALQIRAELSTHIHRETGPQRPTHSFWSFLFEKTKLECGKKLPAFCQRQAHNAVRHAARSRPARSATGHRSRTRAAFTRYCFTSKLYCGSPSSFYRPPHLQSLPYCNTIARPLRNIRPPTDPSLCHTPYNIGDGNILQTDPPSLSRQPHSPESHRMPPWHTAC